MPSAAPDLNSRRVLVALSGGVDSAAAAALLTQQGYEVIAVYLCLQTDYESTGHNRACCSPRDAADAAAIADRLGIDFSVYEAHDDFQRIQDNFACAYQNGRTPNPCILCNQWIKFGKLFELADSLGARFIATGHYARICRDGPKPALYRAAAAMKDQSYVLFSIAPHRLDRLMFPLGELPHKQAARDIVQRASLPVYDKPESQDICFMPAGGLRAVLQQRAPRALTPGPILDLDGNQLGSHDGYGLYTIGQRRGLGIAADRPLYVSNIEPQSAAVTLAPKDALWSDRLTAVQANWLTPCPDTFNAQVKIRYRSRPAPARITLLDDARFELVFENPVLAVTPGQAAVVYQDDHLLGGGWIDCARSQ